MPEEDDSKSTGVVPISGSNHSAIMHLFLRLVTQLPFGADVCTGQHKSVDYLRHSQHIADVMRASMHHTVTESAHPHLQARMGDWGYTVIASQRRRRQTEHSGREMLQPRTQGQRTQESARAMLLPARRDMSPRQREVALCRVSLLAHPPGLP